MGNSFTTLKLLQRQNQGFTLIELVMVIVILGILAAFALPRFADLEQESRVATLDGISGAMRSTIGIIRSVALAQGLTVATANPGNQSQLIVTTEAGSSEVDWRNLCPESRAELGDSLDMRDHISFVDSGELTSIIDNRYTRIGYDIRGTTAPFAGGCYIVYDSFGSPNCTVDVITDDC